MIETDLWDNRNKVDQMYNQKVQSGWRIYTVGSIDRRGNVTWEREFYAPDIQTAFKAARVHRPGATLTILRSRI